MTPAARQARQSAIVPREPRPGAHANCKRSRMRKRRVGVCLLALSALGFLRPAVAAAAPPSAPAHITVRGTSPGTVTVTWDAAPGATEYRVYAGVVEDAGNANPDNNFRFDLASQTYIFNLSTQDLSVG